MTPHAVMKAHGAGPRSPSGGCNHSGAETSNRSAESEGLTELLDTLDEQASDSDELSIRALVEAFGKRSFGPLLASPALVAVSPVGAIPGAPTVLACLIALVAGQHMLGREHPWLPKTLLDRAIDAQSWSKAYERTRPWAQRIDQILEPRLTWLTDDPARRIVSALVVVLAGLMVPLEVVPFAVAVPGLAVLCIGLAVSARDGVMLLAGVLASVVSGFIATTVFL